MLVVRRARRFAVALASVSVAIVVLGAAPPASAAGTALVSADSSGNQANGASLDPAISADGRFVAFESAASNLAPSDTNGAEDIFVRDRVAGVTERVSVDGAGNQPACFKFCASFNPSLSADGRLVAFDSEASNLVPGGPFGLPGVYIHDRLTGATERVSVDSAGN